MKRTLLIIIGIVYTSLLYSQNYHRLIEDNKYFDVALYEQGHICGYSDNIPPRRHFFSGDTIINNKIYSKIHAFNMSPTWPPPPPYCPPFEIDTLYSQQNFFIREDTLSQKVYRCCNGINNDEELLFDFSLQQGDTIGSYHTIDTIVNITTPDNKIRRKFFITNFPDDSGHYTEGLGGNRGPFIFPEPNFEGQYFTMCIKSNDSIIFGNSCYDFITGINSLISKENKYLIYPNPVVDYLHLETTNNSNGSLVNLYNCYGKIIKSEYLTINSNYKIDFSNYSKGIYLLQILDNKGRVIVTKKIIKKSI